MDTGARTCDGCTLCCKLMGIEALAKPEGQWCVHCAVGEGCKIYDTRPQECRAFNCAWLTDTSLSDEWAPKRSRLVVGSGKGGIVIQSDPSRSSAWRKAPFYQTILNWGAAIVPRGGQVLVCEGEERFAILPQGAKALGRPGPDKVIVVTRRQLPQGAAYDALALDKDHPLAVKALAKSEGA